MAAKHPTAVPTITVAAAHTKCEICSMSPKTPRSAIAAITTTDGITTNMCAAHTADRDTMTMVCATYDDKPFPYEYADGELDDVVTAAINAVRELVA